MNYIFKLIKLIIFIILLTGNFSFSDILSENYYTITSSSTNFGYEKRNISLDNDGNYKISNYILQLNSIYNKIETTEVFTDSLSTFEHIPVYYRENTKITSYNHNLEFRFNSSEVFLKFVENGINVKNNSWKIKTGEIVILPDQLSFFLSERLYNIGSTIEISLVDPLEMKLLPTLITFQATLENFLNKNDVFFNQYSVENSDNRSLYIVDQDGNLIEIDNKSDNIIYKLSEELPKNLTPLSEDSSMIEETPPAIENINIINEAVYSVRTSINSVNNLKLSSSFQNVISEKKGSDSVKLIVDRTRYEIPNSGKIVINDFLRKYLKGNDEIITVDGRIISLALKLTKNDNDVVKKIYSLLKYTSNHKLTDTISYDWIDKLNNSDWSKNLFYDVFLSLTRSIGIPTRLTYGMKYDEGLLKKYILCEVHFNGKWFLVDPKYGKFETSPLFLKIADLEKYGKIDKFEEENLESLEVVLMDYKPKFNVSSNIKRNSRYTNDTFEISIPLSDKFKMKKIFDGKTPLFLKFVPKDEKKLEIIYKIEKYITKNFKKELFIKEYINRLNLKENVKKIETKTAVLSGNRAYFFIYSIKNYSCSDIFIFKNDLKLKMSICGTPEIIKEYWDIIDSEFLKFKF